MSKQSKRSRLSEPIADILSENDSSATSVPGVKRRKAKSVSSAGGRKEREPREAELPFPSPVEPVTMELTASNTSSRVLVVAHNKKLTALTPQSIQEYKV